MTVVNPGYEPHAGKQQQFHDDRYEVFARLISAGTGGGKTEAGFHEAWSWTCENPDCVGYIFEPIYPMLNRILIPLMEMRLGAPLEKCPFVAQFHRTENRIKWRNGATWWLVGLDDPEMAEGPNVDWIWADEFRLVGGSGPSARRKQETAWKVFIRRLRGSRPGNETGLWITTTPDAPGSVLYEKFEDPVKRSPNSKVYRWGIDENTFLSEEYGRRSRPPMSQARVSTIVSSSASSPRLQPAHSPSTRRRMCWKNFRLREQSNAWSTGLTGDGRIPRASSRSG